MDFLAQMPGGTAEQIQVTADATDPATAQRELRALAAAKAETGVAKARRIALTADALPAQVPRGIKAIGAAEWFLGAECAAGSTCHPRPWPAPRDSAGAIRFAGPIVHGSRSDW